MELSKNQITQEDLNSDLSALPDETFVQNKRRRVSRACQPCRKSKLKCDGALPQCAPCLTAKRPCSYATTPRRRGLKTGYVRALECLWGLVFENIENSEATVANLAKSALQNGLRLRDDDNNVENSIRPLLDAWRSSRVQVLIDDALDMSDDSEDDGSRIQRKSGLNADFSVSNVEWSFKGKLLEKGATSLEVPSPPRLLQQATDKGQYHSNGHPDMRLPESGEITDVPVVQKPPPGSRELLDVFFSYTQSWLPIVERHTIFKTIYTMSTEISLPSREDSTSGDYAALWAILSYTSLRQIKKDDVKTSAKKAALCEAMHNNARSLIPRGLQQVFQVGHIQALLFLALYRYTTGEWETAWQLTGEAIIFAKEVAAGRPQNSKNEILRRVWLGCFTLDTLVSAQRRRPPLLRKDDVEHCFPLDETGLDEWEPWRAILAVSADRTGATQETDKPTHALSTFNQLVRILCILNTRLHQPPDQSCDATLQLLAEWEIELHDQHHLIVSTNDDIDLTYIPTNFLNLCIVHAYMRKMDDFQSRQTAMGTATQGREGLFGLHWQKITMLSRGLQELSILPPTCQLLQLAVNGPYTLSKGCIAHLGHSALFPEAQPGSNGFLNVDRDISKSAKPQLSHSIQPRDLQHAASISIEADSVTYLPDHNFRTLCNASESLEVHQSYRQDMPRPSKFHSSTSVQDSDRSNNDALSVRDSARSGWDGLVKQTKNGINESRPQSQWKLDDNSVSCQIGVACPSVQQTGQAESPPITLPPGVLDNEEWLWQYFDRIEDFEGNDVEQFQRSLGYSF